MLFHVVKDPSRFRITTFLYYFRRSPCQKLTPTHNPSKVYYKYGSGFMFVLLVHTSNLWSKKQK